MTKYILVNYNYTPTWLTEYTDDYLIYDRSDSDEYLKDFPKEKVIKTDNVGNVDYDKLRYLVDNYDSLPDVFVWGKTNLFKYITKEEFDEVKDNKVFTPLLTQNHTVYSDKYGVVCMYQGGMYHERNDSWYLGPHPAMFNSYKEFADAFNLPSPAFHAFPPGGNFILTKERVHRYSRDFYESLADTLPYTTLPGEAQMCERTYYNLWK